MFPATTQFSREVAKIMALAAQTAYCKAAEAEAICRAHGATEFYFIESQATDTQLFVAIKDWDCVVAFRGSASVRDFICDARISRREWSGVNVHRGFADAFDSIYVKLRPHIEKRRVWFTGHSLGAALATLAAYRFDVSSCTVEGVYLFGSPRVGNAYFADTYNWHLRQRTFRFVHEMDAVCRAPGLLIGYRHVGTEIFLNAFGELQIDLPWWRKLPSDIWGIAKDFDPTQPITSVLATPFKNHFNQNYIERLEKI